jgi:flavin reductase (DIM6/NTAB) family NADH-FMN oxidoreductase RutF
VPTEFTARDLRAAFGRFATGVTVVTAVRPDGHPVGITANSFTSVSLDPPLVLWCIARTSPSVAAFAAGSPFAITILAEREKGLALHFAGRSAAKFPDQIGADATKPPVVPGNHPCRFECVVDSLIEAGDHHIVVGRVLAIETGDGEPLAFHGGKFGRFLSETHAAELDLWAASDVDLPRYFRGPFE